MLRFSSVASRFTPVRSTWHRKGIRFFFKIIVVVVRMMVLIITIVIIIILMIQFPAILDKLGAGCCSGM